MVAGRGGVHPAVFSFAHDDGRVELELNKSLIAGRMLFVMKFDPFVWFIVNSIVPVPGYRKCLQIDVRQRE